jgi:replicative DNA helicase
MALANNDVIIFSLEMSKTQLISKSVSRLTFMEDKSKDKQGHHYARTSRQIMTGNFTGSVEKALMSKALQTYGDYGNNLFIIEGFDSIGAALIKQRVKEHVTATGKCPVVIVDYLQILTPYSTRASDKQSVDKSVLELKRLSMEFKIPVLAVSSFNRDNYSNPVSLASFKESGAIEYSSDVLLGLQFKGMDELNPKADNMKFLDERRRAECRELELKMLKNRHGPSGDRICFNYYPKFNFFQEQQIAKGR